MAKEQKIGLTDERYPYAVNLLRRTLANTVLSGLRGTEVEIGNLKIIEAPSQTGFDYGINLQAADGWKGDVPEIDLVEASQTTGPFLNFRVDMPRFGNQVLNQILEMGPDFGVEAEGYGQRVIIDMSSPNIAKRMSVGHLRSTIIGDALYRIYRSQGYEVIRDNHLGDWGTQFGKQIAAVLEWSSEAELQTTDDPIGLMQDLYVRYESEIWQEKLDDFVTRLTDGNPECLQKLSKLTGYEFSPGQTEIKVETLTILIKQKADIDLEEAKNFEKFIEDKMHSDFEDRGRELFAKLEKGDEDMRRIWKLCVDLSIIEFKQIYETLGVGFEVELGESYFENMLPGVIEKVVSSGVGHTNEGALIIDMRDKGLDVALIQKSDGASLYMTRDLACAIYREEEMRADKVLYVVGDDQKPHFKQLFEALRRLGYRIGDSAEHVYFGMINLREGKMSTRKGRVVLLKDVISEGLNRVDQIIKERNSGLYANTELKNWVVRQIAIGALKFSDLIQDPRRPIEFDWDRALNLVGRSAAFVQYAAVRANSILRDSGVEIGTNLESISSEVYKEPTERALIRQLAEYPNVLREAMKSNNPSKVAMYVYELAKRFNSFYAKTEVLTAGSSELVGSRLKLVAASSQTITNALAILGIEVPEQM